MATGATLGPVKTIDIHIDVDNPFATATVEFINTEVVFIGEVNTYDD